MTSTTIDKLPIKVQVGVAVSFIIALLVIVWAARGEYDDIDRRLCIIEAESKVAKEERAKIKNSSHQIELELKRIGTDIQWIRKEMEKE